MKGAFAMTHRYATTYSETFVSPFERETPEAAKRDIDDINENFAGWTVDKAFVEKVYHWGCTTPFYRAVVKHHKN